VTDWTRRVAELCDLASDALAEGDHEAALARVGEAFTIADADGTQQHPAFAHLLCVAADVAAMSDEIDSARSLYSRAHQVGSATKADGSLVAKALVGLGSIAESEGESAKAAEYYRNAIDALATSEHEDAQVAQAAIREALERLG
jgi:lipopolysaccharide biosynthesis regulator YciM